MLDIDDFKKINDTWGHPFGDAVLMTLASLIRENVRKIDRVGRYGGEEFMVIMPYTTAQSARPIAERIRRAVEEYSFAVQDTPVVITISVGIAAYPDHHEGLLGNKETFLSAVDAALYQAKRAGKNRSMIYWTDSLKDERGAIPSGGLRSL